MILARGALASGLVAPFDPEALDRHRRLTARLAAGDGEALQLLFLDLAPLAHGIVRRMLDDPREGREAVQETFIRVSRRAAEKLERNEAVDAWVVLLARDVALERLRRGAPPALVREGRHRENWSTSAGEAPTAQQWRAVELAFFEGRAVAEIAAGMQTTAVAAMTHLREGLRKIRAAAGRPADEALAVELGRWLLGEIDPQRSAALHGRIQSEPKVAAEAARMAEALARFATDVAPAEPIQPSAQRATLAALIAATGASERGADPALPGTDLRRWVVPVVLVVTALIAGYFVGRGSLAGNGGATTEEKPLRASTGQVRRADQLREDYENLRRAHEVLRGEYDGLVRVVAARMAVPGGADRLLVMELVDAENYARGGRHGLTALARGVLATPGLVTISPGGPATTREEVRKELEPNPPGDAAGLSPAGAGLGASTRPPLAGVGATGGGYGWVVFDDVENQGYLNLYGVPPPAAGEMMFLWERGPEGGDYRAVGEVPAPPAGGTGSFQFKLTAGQPPPGELLITREPRDTAPSKPGANVVLRGP